MRNDRNDRRAAERATKRAEELKIYAFGTVFIWSFILMWWFVG